MSMLALEPEPNRATTPNALNYYGGKARQCKWINVILGPNRRYYVEPFFGMGAVLLNRRRSPIEIVSDINGRVVNWWKVLQTQTDELAEAITATPYSRQVFDEAKDKLDEGTPMERAVRFTVVVCQSRMASDTGRHWTPKRARHPWLTSGFDKRLQAVARRVRKVAIESECATGILRRFASDANAVVYCDPPYWGVAVTDVYRKSAEVDITALLLAQKGRCAVSGYGDMWDHLGWERHERAAYATTAEASGAGKKRTEVLWVNGR